VGPRVWPAETGGSIPASTRLKVQTATGRRRAAGGTLNFMDGSVEFVGHSSVCRATEMAFAARRLRLSVARLTISTTWSEQ
jgi:hypothetical protein